MTSCEKLIVSAARIFPGIRTIIVRFNFTLAFLIILHAAFFVIQIQQLIHGIFSNDFQHQNRSTGVALRPDRLSVITELLFHISKQIFRNIRSGIFRTWRSQDTFC